MRVKQFRNAKITVLNTNEKNPIENLMKKPIYEILNCFRKFKLLGILYNRIEP